MMNCQIIGSSLAMLAVAMCVACSSSSGRPAQDSAAVPPDQIVNFTVLYAQNCAGCHGAEGSGGAAMSLANPTFLAIANDNVIRRIAANGVPDTPMPAFAQSAGGMLTNQQIDALVRGIRSWA
jgi:cytochrome c oxidase cbb3-type subunit III